MREGNQERYEDCGLHVHSQAPHHHEQSIPCSYLTIACDMKARSHHMNFLPLAKPVCLSLNIFPRLEFFIVLTKRTPLPPQSKSMGSQLDRGLFVPYSTALQTNKRTVFLVLHCVLGTTVVFPHTRCPKKIFLIN